MNSYKSNEFCQIKPFQNKAKIELKIRWNTLKINPLKINSIGISIFADNEILWVRGRNDDYRCGDFYYPIPTESVIYKLEKEEEKQNV